MYEKWDTARNIIISSLHGCKGLSGEDLGYYHALPSLAQHNKDAVLLYLLPYLIKPPRGRVGADKTSIREKQEAFFIHANTAADIDGALERQRQICAASNTSLQPIPVFVGPLVNLDAFYVYINDSIENPTIYQAPTTLHAIDLTFKIFFALNCSYATRAQSIWIFLQKAFYDINLTTDKCSRDTHALIGRISQLVQGNENNEPNVA